MFVSSEVAPYSKTGGLGDVSGALPASLQSLGHDLTVVTPLYSSVKDGGHRLHKVYDAIAVPAADGHEFAAYLADDGRTIRYLNNCFSIKAF